MSNRTSRLGEMVQISSLTYLCIHSRQILLPELVEHADCCNRLDTEPSAEMKYGSLKFLSVILVTA